MKHGTRVVLAGLLAVSMAWFIVGCEREIARTSETTVKDDGTVKTEEKRVTEQDGTITVTEEEKTTRPD